MKIAIITITVIAILVWVVIFDETFPIKYRNRKCMGKKWKESFPNTPSKEIRSFLILFTDAFAFSNKNKLKFEPDDKILEIYRELYPHKWMADSLEVETLADDLGKEYSINFNEIWHDELSLGEIFSKIKNTIQEN